MRWRRRGWLAGGSTAGEVGGGRGRREWPAGVRWMAAALVAVPSATVGGGPWGWRWGGV
ncbi:hypothetical protein PAHAL_6G068400 [Panicum hallii]|uniref:Uncharacterized protein n=1 Tax=Panicum hallii TaxID=206008 RepID=A0A2T8IFH1_9POAL|nr:hypothetical protein PAHAL_6G068400 [Panicum hallii]